MFFRTGLVVVGLGIVMGCGLRFGQADTFTVNGQTYTTEFNTGSGADHALMVLQYGGVAGPQATYAFGYSWDPTAGPQDGHDMLLAITANSGGMIVPHIEFFTLPDDPDVLQPFVDTIDYLSNVPTQYNFPFPFDSTTTGFSWMGVFYVRWWERLDGIGGRGFDETFGGWVGG